MDGANIAILAKTTTAHPTLPGTIYTAADELKKLGANVLPIKTDIRFETEVQAAIDQVIAKFGGIDIVVNNASAIKFKNSQAMSMKEFDLIQTINTRGTFLMSKLAYPHLKKASNPHILTLSPPLVDLAPKWLEPCTGYAISKYAMSIISFV
jgi:citronellol/citronellal dehydrogenase